MITAVICDLSGVFHPATCLPRQNESSSLCPFASAQICYILQCGPRPRSAVDSSKAKVNQTFPQRERLRRKRDFDRVFREGRIFQFPEMTMRAVPNGLPHPRMGISVGRRHGNAVRRNRIRRILREAYRLNRQAVPGSLDLVILPRTGWLNPMLPAILPSFREALRKIGEAFNRG